MRATCHSRSRVRLRVAQMAFPGPHDVLVTSSDLQFVPECVWGELWRTLMNRTLRTAAATAAIGIATLSPTTPAHAGDAVGAGIIGFGVGALLGSLLTE
jgi:hypothetical protein